MTSGALSNTGHSTASPPSRQVVVFVLGTSPAVITETLYALLVQDEPFVPDELHVVTTTTGAQALEHQLLAAQTGAFARLLQDQSHRLQGKTPRLTMEGTVHLIRDDKHGEPLVDIVTLQDNQAAARTIFQVLRSLKQVPGTRLHASVAGGRKTMSSYMGQAFSLLADPQDVLTHVLVNEPFERAKPTFYFPPARPERLSADRWDGEVWTSDAELSLAELSVLKLGPLLRTALPADALDDFEAAMKLAKGLLEPFEVRLAVLEPERGAKRRPVLQMLGRHVDVTPMQFVVFLLHAVALNMKLAGEAPDDAFGFGDKDHAILTLADWEALCDLHEIPLSSLEVEEPAPNFTVYSKLIDRLRSEVGEVAERLRLVRVMSEGEGGPGRSSAPATKQYRFTDRVPALILDGLLTPPSERLVKGLVGKLMGTAP